MYEESCGFSNVTTVCRILLKETSENLLVIYSINDDDRRKDGLKFKGIGYEYHRHQDNDDVCVFFISRLSSIPSHNKLQVST